jgi:hypothetical protein
MKALVPKIITKAAKTVTSTVIRKNCSYTKNQKTIRSKTDGISEAVCS